LELQATEREYPSQPLVGVGGIVVKGDEVLLVRRGQSPGKGSWSIPGGLVELGEEMRDAVERELREEVGLDVDVGAPLDVFDRIESGEEGETRFHYVIVDFLVESFSGSVQAGSDVHEIRWASMADLSGLGVPSPVRRLLEYAQSIASTRNGSEE